MTIQFVSTRNVLRNSEARRVMCLSVQFEEEIARKKTTNMASRVETSVPAASPPANTSTTSQSDLAPHSVATICSQLPVLQTPDVAAPKPLFTFRVLPRVTESGPFPVSSQLGVPNMSSPMSRFRPPCSVVTAGFQSAFNRASVATIPSLYRQLTPSVVGHHPGRGHLPLSSSTPNLTALGGKHVLLDSCGQVISTVVPPGGGGRHLDDGKPRKTLPVMPGMASVSLHHRLLKTLINK